MPTYFKELSPLQLLAYMMTKCLLLPANDPGSARITLHAVSSLQHKGALAQCQHARWHRTCYLGQEATPSVGTM
eukprot:2741715-Amphidinium_carterae.1